MSRDHQQHHTPQPDRNIVTTPLTAPAAASAEATKAVEEFADTGRGSAKDMPRLIKMMTGHDQQGTTLLLPRLAKRMNGELFLECAAAFEYKVYFAVEAALDDAKPAASEAALRRYLRSRELGHLVKLDEHEGVIDRLRKMMPGSLGRELPSLSEVPAEMHTKQNLMRWYIDSTPPNIVAVELARAGTAEIAATLDAIDRWAWLDHLHIGGGVRLMGQMHMLADATKNAAAKTKLAAMLKKVPARPDGDKTQIQEDARAELDASVGGKVATPDLLDMTARAGTVAHRPETEMIAQIKGKPAADVLQFAIASQLSLLTAVPLLLDAPGVGPEHVMSLINSHGLVKDRLEVLRHDRLRNRIRNIVGRSTPLLDFFTGNGVSEAAHLDIIADEALRQWGYESKDPRTLLWLAVGTSDNVRKSLGHVEREQGVKWVYALPIDAEASQLRRFMLATKDVKARQHVQEHLLGDRPINYDADEWKTQSIDPAVLGAHDRARFDVSVRLNEASEEEILGRISDLEPAERADVVKDANTFDATLKRLSGESLSRAVFALSPTLPQLFGTSLVFEPRLLSYLRTRTASEEHATVVDSRLARNARGMFHTSPFVVFPSLLDSNVLAKALEKNSSMLSWILNDADPNQALGVLSREPARAHAAAALEGDEDLYKRFPRYRFLLPEGKAGFDAIATEIEDDDGRREAKRYKDNQRTPDRAVGDTGKQLHEAVEGEHVWDALAKLGDKIEAKTALALVRAYPKDQVELLSGRHSEAVAMLRGSVHMAPQHVFPQLGVAQLLACPDAAAWLFEVETSFMVLVLVAGNQPAIKQLGRLIDAAGDAATAWLASLKGGAMLEGIERQVLDELRVHVTGAAELRKLFAIRFGVEIQPEFDAKKTKDVWAVLRRLPPAQINQQAIESFRRGPTPGAAGYWADPDVVLSDDDKSFDEPDTAYDKAAQLTAAEIKKYYGLDDAAFAKATDPKTGWIEEINGKYKVKPIRTDSLTGTVLHEVGHSVDTMLGERTELVFGLAGWKNYGLDQIEEWAKDMGALEGVRGKAREQIVEAWRHALRTGTDVVDLVPAGHPAIDKSLKHVPLVAAALDRSRFEYEQRREVNGRIGLTSNNQGTIASVPKATADVAPSAYSLYAPPEFFAECYVEYYREFDGTAATASKKGGKLATWIKDWFHANVDKIELNPRRYQPKDGG